MYFKFRITMVFALLCIVVKGQDRKEAYEKAVNYCYCKIAYAVCADFAKNKPETDKGKALAKIFDGIKCNIGECPKIGYLNKRLVDNYFPDFGAKSYAVMKKVLDSYTESQDSTTAANLIIDGIYNDDYLKSLSDNFKEVPILKNPLTTDVVDYLEKHFTSQVKVSGVTLDNLANKVAQLESMVKDPPTQSSFGATILGFLIIIAFVALYLIFSKRLNGLNEQIRQQKIAYDPLKDKFENDKMQTSNQMQMSVKEFVVNFNGFKIFMEQKIIELNTEISHLHQEVRELQNNNEQRTSTQLSYKPPVSEEREERMVQKYELLYAPIPNKNGSFSISAISNTINPSSTFYKLTIIDSRSQKGQIEILNEERVMRDAITSPEMILNPVCKARNAHSHAAKRIRTIIPGTVKKQDDKWIVESLAEIEYEY